MSRKCAYCGRGGPVTREEVFPKVISEKIGFSIFVDQTRSGKPTGAVTVRDVCRRCNNELLGALDQYVGELYKDYWAEPVREPVDILFAYRYDLLLRWLLKAFYNAARARAGQAQLEPLRLNVPYMLGATPRPHFRTSVLVGVALASSASLAEQELGMPVVFSPLVHKFGDLHFDDPSKESVIALSQSVSLNSYFFLVLVFRSETADPVRRAIVEGVARDNRVFELDPADKKVRITRVIADARAYLFARKTFRFN